MRLQSQFVWGNRVMKKSMKLLAALVIVMGTISSSHAGWYNPQGCSDYDYMAGNC